MSAAPIRAIVVDDEPVARARVRALLEDEDDVELVGECTTPSDAIATITTAAPDLVFLDIQMAEMNGLELARTLGSDRPAVIFITAYDEFALRAFEIRALDYLLKPFSAERFRSALAHAREHVALRRASALGQDVMAMLPGVDTRTPRQRLVVRSSGRIYFVPIADIDWCEAAGNYVRLHVGAHTHLVRETMHHIETELDATRFVRIHRSVIVNIDRIQELRSSFNGEYVVVLRNGVRLTLSRSYRESLQARLGKPL